MTATGCAALGAQQVDFVQSIHPILEQRCASCHSGNAPQADLSVMTRESLLKGGAHGAAIKPGHSSDSLLIQRVKGEILPAMPMGGARLSAQEVQILSDWIDQNAPWGDVEVKAPVGWTPPMAPRRPAIPESKYSNPIDRFLDAYFRKNGIDFPDAVPDNIYIRRAYMDIWGVIPSARDVNEFLVDRSPGKRERLVDRLLAGDTMYSGNWISFWNDLLRNDQGVNYAGTRKSITPWLQSALMRNMPYTQMIAELVNPSKDGPEGFLLGVNWRGDINASQTPFMQAAQNTAQVFLGVNLKCASCHDSFINRYKLKQSYGMAALFSSENSLELVRCDKKTGKSTGPAFLFPEIGTIPEGSSTEQRRAAAAKLFTAPENGRVDRTMVNRLWSRFFGHGLVEPVDEMDLEPWNADLLDWLAVDFADHGADLKHTMRQILTSRAYQMPSVPGVDDRGKSYVFRGPRPRRLTAEQFLDTVSSLTGEWRVLQTDEKAIFVREWQLKSTPLSRALGRPIRDQVFTSRNPEATTLQALEMVNGDTLGLMLRRGAKRLLRELPEPPAPIFDSKTLRKEGADLDVNIKGNTKLWFLITDVDCYDPTRSVVGWANVELIGPAGSRKLSELASVTKMSARDITSGGKPYNDVLTPAVPSTMVYDISGMQFERLRGRIVVDDGSVRDDIEPSVRAFVFSAEPDEHQLIRVSGDPPLPAPQTAKQADQLINELFLEALCRRPSRREIEVARALLAPQGKPTDHGLEDLLWSLLMHPEMQYVY